jgi:cation diffusion facilitator family transporter
VADPGSTHLLTGPTAAARRYAAIARVLWRVLLLNLLVAGAEITVGILAGSVAIMSGGFHSLTDAASNVVALVGVSIARRPPDANHPYGHRKFETMAAGGILLFLLLVLIEIVSTAVGRLREGGTPEVEAIGVAVVAGTLVINVFVMRYEAAAGVRLGSEILRADARHTRADVLISCAVLVALAGVWAGLPLLDPLAALSVAGFIGLACWQIAQEASRILSDEIVIDPERLRATVLAVPGVLGVEKIRTRGSRDHVFLDLHLWVAGTWTLDQAHAHSHVVKARLMEAFPQIADAVIHVEPPPADGRDAL